MKKQLISLLSAAALAASPLSAEDQDIEQYAFAGITAANAEQLDENAFFGFRMGAQNNIWRTMFTYEDNIDEMQSLFLEIDRTIIGGMADNRLRLYVGALGGWMRDNADPEKIDGYGYGGSLGLMFYLTDQIDVDLGYRYLEVEDLTNVKRIQGVTFALHYFF